MFANATVHWIQDSDRVGFEKHMFLLRKKNMFLWLFFVEEKIK